MPKQRGYVFISFVAQETKSIPHARKSIKNILMKLKTIKKVNIYHSKNLYLHNALVMQI